MPGLDLDKSKVLVAVGALVASEKSKKKDNIIQDVDLVHLQITVKKIPQKDATFKLKLPHAVQPSSVEVCLFVKDLDRFDRDYEQTVHHFKDFLQKKGISSITEVIPLKSLKMEYKPFNAKLNLANSYSIFLADSRIIRLLPKLLGKHFYGKNKQPVQVNLQAKDLAKEVDAAINNSRCCISSKGSSSRATVANLEMNEPDIVDNIIAAASQISTSVPGGASNIKQLSIKTALSISIPIYMAEGGPQDVNLPRKEKPAVVEAEEISTMLDAKVKVYPDGRISIIKDADEKTENVEKRQMRKRKNTTPLKKHTTPKKKGTDQKRSKGKSDRPAKRLKAK